MLCHTVSGCVTMIALRTCLRFLLLPDKRKRGLLTIGRPHTFALHIEMSHTEYIVGCNVVWLHWYVSDTTTNKTLTDEIPYSTIYINWQFFRGDTNGGSNR